jgi:predicted transcriptional regulator
MSEDQRERLDENITIRISHGLLHQIQRLARDEKRTAGAMARILIEEALAARSLRRSARRHGERGPHD